MKYKVGDTVRIQSKEWMDAQEKGIEREIVPPEGWDAVIHCDMQKFSGELARIVAISGARDDRYKLDIDDRQFFWEDWMFDPDYKADEPMSAKDAIRAMLDGETLYDNAGLEYSFLNNTFYLRDNDEVAQYFNIPTLSRRPKKRKRLMTRWEVLDWVNSEASRGWAVLYVYDNGNKSKWSPPQFFDYATSTEQYRRARLLPDLSGVDESTIQGFEVEE